ncbi:hypothetical protein AMTR_s00010p00070590 [Amborella trichopoda]|uniref:Uncharacterized protein n=1 Tax=Amborella trichopoda TaxID=13333 RepID=W1NF19_AMBTC|nr:hypothetical protein AMTR_s00010p00070590 [Amborella trichopoda]
MYQRVLNVEIRIEPEFHNGTMKLWDYNGLRQPRTSLESDRECEFIGCDSIPKHEREEREALVPGVVRERKASDHCVEEERVAMGGAREEGRGVADGGKVGGNGDEASDD